MHHIMPVSAGNNSEAQLSLPNEVTNEELLSPLTGMSKGVIKSVLPERLLTCCTGP